MKLTSEQKRAVNHSTGNLQMIACAGSGKTEVVARRVANLLKPGPKALLWIGRFWKFKREEVDEWVRAGGGTSDTPGQRGKRKRGKR